jgi:hypothetical protein
MNPVDRYLKSLRAFLPSAVRDDILEELSEDLRAQIDQKEEELGRPLTVPEQEAVLGQLDPPLVVAARYLEDHRTLAFGRQLIGPALFPLYVRVLKINLSVAAAVIVGISLATGRPLGAAVPQVLINLLVQFGVVTLIFSLIEAYQGMLLISESEVTRTNAWSSSRTLQKGAALQPPTASRGGHVRTSGTDAPVSRLESAAELVVLAVFVWGLVAIRHSPQWVLGEGDVLFQFHPIWQTIYVPFLLILVMNMLQAIVNLYRPDWTHVRSAAAVLTYGACLVLAGVLLHAGQWVVHVGSASALTAQHQRHFEFINTAIFYNLLGTSVVLCVLLLIELRHLIRRGPGKAAPGLSSQPMI